MWRAAFLGLAITTGVLAIKSLPASSLAYSEPIIRNLAVLVSCPILESCSDNFRQKASPVEVVRRERRHTR